MLTETSFLRKNPTFKSRFNLFGSCARNMNLLINDTKTPSRFRNDDEYPLKPTYQKISFSSLAKKTRHRHNN